MSSTTSTPATSTPKTPQSSSSASRANSSTYTEEKILPRFTGVLLAEGSKKKIEVAEHFKRLAHLRKESDQLEKTDWQFEPVEKLLGK